LDRRIFPKLMVIGLSMIVMLFFCEQADARKKRKRFISPVKVEDVVISPDPFIIGKSPLTVSMMLKVPLSAVESKVLEVSVLITSPTRRTMSFVSRRLSLAEVTQGGTVRMVPMNLVWDGKDQYDRFVTDGSYFYEIQAKLLEDKGNGPRTKIVSHRIQGTLEALAYVGEVLPPLAPEPDVPAEVEALQQKVLATDDLLVVEDKLIVGEQSTVGQGELSHEGGKSMLQKSDAAKGIVEEKVLESKDNVETVSEESDSKIPISSETKTVLPAGDLAAPIILEPPLIQAPTESSGSSMEKPLQH